MDAFLKYINFQLRNSDEKVSGTFFKKSKTVFMTFETGFFVQKKCHGMLFEIKNVSCVSASKLSMCHFHKIYTDIIKNKVLFSKF
jgi:hypothetical protein